MSEINQIQTKIIILTDIPAIWNKAQLNYPEGIPSSTFAPVHLLIYKIEGIQFFLIPLHPNSKYIYYIVKYNISVCHIKENCIYG